MTKKGVVDCNGGRCFSKWRPFQLAGILSSYSCFDNPKAGGILYFTQLQRSNEGETCFFNRCIVFFQRIPSKTPCGGSPNLKPQMARRMAPLRACEARTEGLGLGLKWMDGSRGGMGAPERLAQWTAFEAEPWSRGWLKCPVRCSAWIPCKDLADGF